MFYPYFEREYDKVLTFNIVYFQNLISIRGAYYRKYDNAFIQNMIRTKVNIFNSLKAFSEVEQ